MKTKEIVNEVNWNKVKKSANYAIKFGDALMGTSGTKGFDLGAKSKELKNKQLRIVKQTVLAFNTAWKQIAQRYVNSNQTPTADDLVQELNQIISNTFGGINPEDSTIKRLIKELAILTRDEIANGETKFAENVKIQQRIIKLVNSSIELEADHVDDDEPDDTDDVVRNRPSIRMRKALYIKMPQGYWVRYKHTQGNEFRWKRDIIPKADASQDQIDKMEEIASNLKRLAQTHAAGYQMIDYKPYGGRHDSIKVID